MHQLNCPLNCFPTKMSNQKCVSSINWLEISILSRIACTWEQKFSFSVPLNWQMSDWTEPLFSPLPYAHVCAPCGHEKIFFFKSSHWFHSLSLVKRGLKKRLFVITPDLIFENTLRHCFIFTNWISSFILHYIIYSSRPRSFACCQDAAVASRTVWIIQKKSRRRLEGIRFDWMRNQSYKSHLGYVWMPAQMEDNASVCNAIVVFSDIRMMIELKHTSIKWDPYQTL